MLVLVFLKSPSSSKESFFDFRPGADLAALFGAQSNLFRRRHIKKNTPQVKNITPQAINAELKE